MCCAAREVKPIITQGLGHCKVQIVELDRANEIGLGPHFSYRSVGNVAMTVFAVVVEGVAVGTRAA